MQWASAAIFPAVLAGPLVDRSETLQRFELLLTWQSHAPDGFERDMILVNGQFPGPLIEIDQGNEVEILVHNKMPYNTTIHYHGMASVSVLMRLSDIGRYRDAQDSVVGRRTGPDTTPDPAQLQFHL